MHRARHDVTVARIVPFARNQMLDLRFDVGRVSSADEVEMLENEVGCRAFVGGTEGTLFDKKVGLGEAKRRRIRAWLRRVRLGGRVFCGLAIRGLSRNLRHLLAAWPQLAPRKSRKWLGRQPQPRTEDELTPVPPVL